MIKPHLKFECKEDWNKMKIGMLSRHCAGCKKDVINFTKMTKEEVLMYLLENREQEICGHIQKSKLDFHLNKLKLVTELNEKNIPEILKSHFYLTDLIKDLTDQNKRSFSSTFKVTDPE